MIPKNRRVYIKEWFDDEQEFKEGDVIEFDMPAFCSGDYLANVHIDSDGEPYIHKNDSYFMSSLGFYIR